MSAPTEYTQTRYLSAKKTADDRALNRHVWATLVDQLAIRYNPGPLRILDIGTGTGSMVERLVEWGALSGGPNVQTKTVEMWAIDSQAECISVANQLLRDWGVAQGFHVGDTMDASQINLVNADIRLRVQLETIDLFDFIAREHGRRKWDLIVANAFLDLMDLATALPMILSLIVDRGLFYFGATYDGVSIWEPETDRQFDEFVPALFHQTRDERITAETSSGDSRAGRHLFHQIRRASATVLDMGSSDWVIAPYEGEYPGDEAYLLHFILKMVEAALTNRHELDQNKFAKWIAARHKQVDQRVLVYVAHQMDVLGRV